MTRLAEIDADEFASDVVRRIEEHVSSLAIALGRLVTWRSLHGEDASADWRATEIGRAAAALCRYAQTGDPAHVEGLPHEYLISMVPLWTSPGARGTIDLPWEDLSGSGPEEPLEVVTLAADGRMRLGEGQPVPVRQLAALAGVQESSLRTMASRRRKLRVSGGEVMAADAQRWLGARGVPGCARGE